MCVVQGVEESAEVTINRQTALYSLKLLARLLSKEHPDKFKKVCSLCLLNSLVLCKKKDPRKLVAWRCCNYFVVPVFFQNRISVHTRSYLHLGGSFVIVLRCLVRAVAQILSARERRPMCPEKGKGCLYSARIPTKQRSPG